MSFTDGRDAGPLLVSHVSLLTVRLAPVGFSVTGTSLATVAASFVPTTVATSSVDVAATIVSVVALLPY